MDYTRMDDARGCSPILGNHVAMRCCEYESKAPGAVEMLRKLLVNGF